MSDQRPDPDERFALEEADAAVARLAGEYVAAREAGATPPPHLDARAAEFGSGAVEQLRAVIGLYEAMRATES